MDTSKLKSFAQQARKLIKEGVKFELQKKGFNADGSVAFEPTKISGGTIFDGELYGEHFYDQWMALKNRIASKGLENVFEEAAYTWFNRLIALQILSKNNIISVPVLEFADATRRIPKIVEEARNGRWENIDSDSQKKVQAIINDYTKVQEQFAILVSSYCRNTPLINKCFGGIDDYTEILLPSNILSADNFICLLNNTPFITDEDYHTTELLGWLYQFYISEKKDEVFESFKKKHKATCDEVPAATQIFTPNWIVKYMVENTLGRIYLDHDPYANFKDEMKYLVEPCEGERPIYQFEEVKDLRCADFSCGSGHILNEFFDLLLKCYEEEGIFGASAIEKIFKYNILGIDLDTRAKQLSIFSLLLKACQREKDAFVDAHIMPRVLDMPVPVSMNEAELKAACLKFIGGYESVVGEELEGCFELLKDANELGSIMKFELDDDSVAMIRAHFDDWTAGGTDDCPEDIKALLPGVDLILALSEKYSAICMNPPYMKSANMNDILKDYIDSNYEEGNPDLYSVFMMMSSNHIEQNGRFSMIVQPTWLVNSTFAGLRAYLSNDSTFESLLHMGRGNFGNDWGSIAFTMGNYNSTIDTQFFKLYERTFYRIAPDHISSLFIVANKNHNARYDFSSYDTSSFNLNDLKSGRKLYYSCNVDRFNIIPNHPYCYSFNDDILNTIVNTRISHSFNPATGLQTGDNKRFIKQWTEISFQDFQTKWYPLVNGGEFRRWYGNFNDLIYWYNNGSDIRNNGSSVIRNQQYYLRQGITWNRIASRGITLRTFPEGCIFDQAGDSMFSDNLMQLFVCMGYLNSIVGKTFFEMLAPGLNLTAGVVGNLPYIDVPNEYRDKIIDSVKDNISYSKLDWDAHETSWDFKRNPIIEQQLQLYVDEISDTMPNLTVDDLGAVHMPELQQPIEVLVDNYCSMWEDILHKLHHNEEELNRKFIEIYGLQDELTLDVSLNDITILQKGEISIIDNQIQWNKDVIIKQLISYAIGCMMGRYRLDRPGLHIAHPDAKDSEKVDYPYNGDLFSIDDDGIIPLLPRDCPFSDNAIIRLENFIRLVFGEDHFKDNWNYITQTLGNTENYLLKPTGFWKDHKAMYQKTPIYWLFSSKKGTFKCLVYMHRMNQFTAREVRDKYLLKYIEFLRNMIKPLEAEEATLGREDKKKLKGYKEALADCEEYDLRLHEVAQKFIDFDLDDGVKKNYAKFGDILATI